MNWINSRGKGEDTREKMIRGEKLFSEMSCIIGNGPAFRIIR